MIESKLVLYMHAYIAAQQVHAQRVIRIQIDRKTTVMHMFEFEAEAIAAARPEIPHTHRRAPRNLDRDHASKIPFAATALAAALLRFAVGGRPGREPEPDAAAGLGRAAAARAGLRDLDIACLPSRVYSSYAC